MKAYKIASWVRFSLGVFIGLLVICILRIWYYEMMEYRPNMHPGIALFFTPILWLFVMFLSCPVEYLINRFLFTYSSKLSGFVFGLIYSTAVIWWAFPGHWKIFFVVNPIVLRTGIGLWLVLLQKNNK